MQSSTYLSLLVSGTADRYVQERVKEAERHALIKSAKGRRPSVVRSLRLSVGQFMVVSGKWVAGRPRRAQRPIDVPAALEIAR
jgi:hypothetical protein